MTLAKKFITILISSIIFITIINIVSFYLFYSSYLKQYLAEKIESRENVTIDYINNIIERQTIDDIDDIFSNTEIEFFELLENNEGGIPLDKEKNVNTVVDYLIKKGVAPKYIEELIPSDNFGKILESLKDKNSPEYRFISKFTTSIIIINILAIFIISITLLIFTKKIIGPIKRATYQIKKISLLRSKKRQEIVYHNKSDEIGLLITSINNLNTKLSQQESIRSRLLSDISHELKTPITSIQCYLEGISDGVIKLNEKNLKSITEEMKRLTLLVNKIMEYEKFENKKLKLEISNENISEIIKEITETHKKRLKENKQRIKITGIEEMYMKVDKNLFKQIIHNIIGNFLKYAGDETLLKINITKNYINFSDNGKGIKQSEVPLLTEKFYQGNMENSNIYGKNKGIGVGLSLVEKIINAHNWEYEIKSDENKGFNFKIKI
ncbi:hypothetical protein CSB07_01745 [Candidatus Gracilibacteria bacterium]|nr:MAG: hypothetical protein CSB07_01745 [Candidatus Gracilibacteria bacterium]PIE85193.1 MAG: hypothetical protein CSA08_02955 [Candidatus Gracilibacteria bacterium]